MYDKIISRYFDKYYDTLEDNKIKEIINYSLSGGKCIRGFIVKHIMNELSGGVLDEWEPIVSVELLHSVSLMLDDLPCMDNDMYRRGVLSCHAKFGSAKTILSSMYIVGSIGKLLFNCLSRVDRVINIVRNGREISSITSNSMDIALLLNREVNDICGRNMLIGQMTDLNLDMDMCIRDDDYKIMLYKTGSLFSLSFILGGIFSYKEGLDIDDFEAMGANFGVMFQILDDFNDMDNESGGFNYVRKNGDDVSYDLYKKSRKEFCRLLKKYNIYTLEFKKILRIFNKKIVKYTNKNDSKK